MPVTIFRRGALRIAVFLIALECFFRLGGLVSDQWSSVRRNLRLKEQADVRILCLGESITASGDDNAWPVLLEKILNQQNPEKIYRVFNLARAGQNSSYSADRIEAWIREYQPDYVVMMIGAMDPLKSGGSPESGFAGWIKKFRIIQALDVLHKKEKAEFLRSESEGDGPGPVKTQMELIWDAVDALPPDKKAVSQIALYADVMGRLAEARKLYQVILQFEELSNVHSFIRSVLADLIWKQKDYPAYVEELRHIPYYSWQGDLYEKLCPQPGFREGILDAIREHQAKKPDMPYYEDMIAACYEAGGEKNLADAHRQKARELRRRQMNPFTEKNYKKILSILARYPDIIPVLVQYPMRDLEQLKAMVQGSPGYGRFIFVDNDRNFKDVLHRFSYADLFLDRAAGDFGHGTPQGNRLIAQSIADAILTGD